MARLPTTLDMQAPRGASPSGDAVDFRGLQGAMESAGRELNRWDEARRKADDEVAGRELETVRQTYAQGAGERAALYDGREPGFSTRELGAFDEAVAPLLAREDLPDGVRDSLTRQSRELRVRVGAEAIGLESRARGQRAAADRDAADQASAVRAWMGAMTVFDGLEDNRRDEWDGASAGFAEGLLGDFRLSVEQARTGLTGSVLERFNQMALSREVQLQASAMAAEDEGRDASTMRTVSDGLQAIVNRAARDPSMLARIDAEMAPVLAAAPAQLRERLGKEARAEATTQSLQTRIDNGEFEAVQSEVQAGTYDWLDPSVVSRLNDRIQTAERVRTEADALAEADLMAEVDRDIVAVLGGGTPDATLASRIGAALGPDAAARVRIDQQAAQRLQSFIPRLRTLNPAELQAELARFEAAGGDAVGARTLELVRQRLAEDQQRRGGDPAAWAATPNGAGDQVGREVQQRLSAFVATPTQETAEAYARATWLAQERGGVGLLQRRLLPTATAEAWVEELEADGSPASGLAALGQRVALFGPGYQGQIVRELGLAGLSQADTGAVAYYAASPRRLALYAQGRSKPLNQLVTASEDRAEIDLELARGLAPWRRTIATGAGGEAGYEAARVMAYGMVARGESVRNAVRTATAAMTDDWAFEDTWAIPARTGLDTRRVAANAGWWVHEMARTEGRLAAPRAEGLTPEQSARNYRDRVRNFSQLRNLADGSGVQLVIPKVDGSGWEAVMLSDGSDARVRFDALNRPRERRDGEWVTAR